MQLLFHVAGQGQMESSWASVSNSLSLDFLSGLQSSLYAGPTTVKAPRPVPRLVSQGGSFEEEGEDDDVVNRTMPPCFTLVSVLWLFLLL